MNKNSQNLFQEIDDFFNEEPSTNQKAWGVINQFYHLILTYMDKNKISQAELSRRINKSRSYVSQMFNKTPNVSVKKMVEIADAVGINLHLNCKEIPIGIETKHLIKKEIIPVFIVKSEKFNTEIIDPNHKEFVLENFFGKDNFSIEVDKYENNYDVN